MAKGNGPLTKGPLGETARVEEPRACGGDEAEAPGGDDGAHRRTQPRDSMFLGATLRHPQSDEAWPVRVRNISAGGLMADFDGQLQRGDHVEIELRVIGLISATVAWAAQGKIGLSFDQRIDPLLVRRQIGSRGGTSR